MKKNFHEKINRYDFVRILYNLINEFTYEKLSVEEENLLYQKIGDIGIVVKDGYEKDVLLAVHHNLISGVDKKGTFNGKKNLNRAQLASFYTNSIHFKNNILNSKKSDKNKTSQNSNIINVAILNEKQKKQLISELFDIINKERENIGVPILKMDEKLNELAAHRAKEIMENFEHIRPDGRNSLSIFDDYELEFSKIGENIASGQKNSQKLFDAWMGSETHKKNLLDPKFEYTGISIQNSEKENDIFSPYWVQLFMKKKE